jgi:hypothetical protein
VRRGNSTLNYDGFATIVSLFDLFDCNLMSGTPGIMQELGAERRRTQIPLDRTWFHNSYLLNWR